MRKCSSAPTCGDGRASEKRHSRPAELRVVLGAIAWVSAAGAVLALADVPGEFGGSLCGVWGCYPPFQAVAAMHLFWCVVFLPVVWGLNRFAPGWLPPAGSAMTVAALVAAVVIVGRDVSTWLDRSPAEYHTHWPKRAAHALFTLTDVPLCQTFLAGLACLGLGRQTPADRISPTPAPPAINQVEFTR